MEDFAELDQPMTDVEGLVRWQNPKQDAYLQGMIKKAQQCQDDELRLLEIAAANARAMAATARDNINPELWRQYLFP